MTAASAALRFWIDMSLECVRRDHTKVLSIGDQKGPFLSARALGMALAALNDAHAHLSGGKALLTLPSPGGTAGAKADLVAAAACHQVLRLRYPNQLRFLDPAWGYWLEYFGLGATGSASEAVGRTFGAAVHALGVADPAKAAVDQYTPSGRPYTHIAPPNEPMQHYSGGVWGQSTHLVGARVANFPPPPGRTSATTVMPTPHYAADHASVAAKGVLDRSMGTRTLDEEVTGIAWGYDGPQEIGTPPRLYLQIVLNALDIIEARAPRKLSLADELLIVAGIAVAMADAGIEAWHFKYAPDYMMWRPVVGIPNAQPGNGTPDPGWLPLGRPDTNGTGVALTPDFPAYPSGHATFGSSALQLLRLFLVQKGVAKFDAKGVDDFSFDFVSDEFNGRSADPRTMMPREYITLGFSSLWEAIVANSLSRVFLGVHWQFDGITKRNQAGTRDKFGVPSSPDRLGHTGGVWLGGQIAKQIAPKLGIRSSVIVASKMT